ncbi:MAG: hypothetical protein EAX89_10785 [Candidatus Lokiarchaeota archaeon]|nr:hypothetical protein [Candidatus Lokiarchaeota archaeon]
MQMKRGLYPLMLIVFFLPLIALLSLELNTTSYDDSSNIYMHTIQLKEEDTPRIFQSSLIIHDDQIIIDGNLDFHNTATIKGWSGDGSKENPYLVKSITVNASEIMISIKNTNLFFRVRNFLLSGGKKGIYLENISNGEISDCVIENVAYGIQILSSNNCSLLNNTIKSCRYYGIHVGNNNQTSVISNNINMTGNSISLCQKSGINFVCSDGNLVMYNYISENENGIHLSSSHMNYFIHNRIYNNLRSGILLEESGNNTILNNNFRKNGLLISGSLLKYYIQTSISGNTVNDFPLVYLMNDVVNKAIPENSSQVFIINSSNFQISGLRIFESTVGISVAYSSNFSLLNNYITQNNKFGMSLYLSKNFTLYNNSLHFNLLGLQIKNSSNYLISKNSLINNEHAYFETFSSNCTIYSNIVSHNTHEGIYLNESRGLTISANFISNNENGLVLSASNQNTVSNNFIYDNINGIQLFRSHNNTLFGNSIFNNKINGMYIFLCENSSIQNNYFIETGIYIIGSNYDHYSQSTIVGNLLNAAPIIYWVEIKDKRVPVNIGQIILVNCSSITISDVSLSKTAIGIIIGYCQNITVIYSEINNNQDGIHIINSTKIILYKNKINQNSGCGISLESSTNCTIENNSVIDNDIGIKLSYSANNTLINNYLRNNGLSIIGNNIAHYLQTSVKNNEIQGKDIIYWRNKNNITLSGNIAQIFLINCSRIQVEGLKVSGVPIFLLAIQCSNLYISENFILRNHEGIKLVNVTNSSLCNNVIAWNRENGVKIVNSSFNYFYNNSFSYNLFGIIIDNSTNNIFSINSIYSNAVSGIKIISSNRNVFKNISFSKNGFYGIYLDFSAFNIIKENNFINNNLDAPSQAIDYAGVNNTFIYNYWNDWTKPDMDLDGIVDYYYEVSGSSHSIDPLPSANPYKVELYLLDSFPCILTPSGGEIINDIADVKWTIATSPSDTQVNYSIFYSTDLGMTWNFLVANLNSNYSWNTRDVHHSSNCLIKIVAYDSEGLLGFDVSKNSFIIDNTFPYKGFTLTKVAIGATLVFFLIFGFITIYKPLNNFSYPAKSRKTSFFKKIDNLLSKLNIYFQNLKWIIIAVLSTLLLSFLRAWLIDPNLVVSDGYVNYAHHMKNLLFNWEYEIDKYAKEPHQFRIVYPLLVASISLLFPFMEYISIGRIISIISFLLSIIYFSKILERFDIASKKITRDRICIIFILNPTIITNAIRFETDILFLCLMLYAFHQYLTLRENTRSILIQKLNFISVSSLLVFTREVGIIFIFAVFLMKFVSSSKFFKISILLMSGILILVGYWLSLTNKVLFYLVWTVSNYDYAYNLIYNGNWFILIELLINKFLDQYYLLKTFESLFYTFFPSIIFVLIGFGRFYYNQSKKKRKLLIQNVFSVFFIFYVLSYIFLKAGRGLDRFWIPLIPLSLLYIAYTYDLGSIKLQVSCILNRTYLSMFKNRKTASFHSDGMIEKSMDIFGLPPSEFPSSTFYFICLTQIIIFVLRIVLSLINTGILPVYNY